MEIDVKVLVAVIGIIGSLLTAVIGFYYGKRKTYLEYNKDISLEAWKERSNQYKLMTKIMGVLPKYPHKIGIVTYSDLLACSDDLKDWYFEGGGLFLTKESRDNYFDVQKEITEKIMKGDFSDTNELLGKKMTEEDYSSVRKLMSKLRTELTNDLLSRERYILTDKNEEK